MSSSRPESGPPTMSAERHAEIEEAENLSAHAAGKPVGEVKNGAGEKTGLSHSEQQAQHIKRSAAADEHGGHGGQPQATMRKEIQILAPMRWRIRLLGNPQSE